MAFYQPVGQSGGAEMGGSFEVRLAAVAGWIGFVGIVVAFIVYPMAVAGQPPTVNTEPGAVMAYFRHPEFALINGVLGVFFGILTILLFGYGLRSILATGTDRRARTFADLGLALLIVTLPVYLVSGAIGAMLVQAADGDPATFTTLFRLYDLIYNGGADVLEGAWIGAFSLAALWGPLPRWIGWLGVAVMASRWIKAFVPVAPVPEIVVAIGGVLFLSWFLVIVVALTREARRPDARTASVPAAA
jgi:hypothetical protein